VSHLCCTGVAQNTFALKIQFLMTSFFIWNKQESADHCMCPFFQVNCNEWLTKIFTGQNRTSRNLKWQKKYKLQTQSQIQTEKSILLYLVTECYCIPVTFVASFANSEQGNWKFWNASSISVSCFGYRTDIWVVQTLSPALLQTFWPCHSISLSACLFFHDISLKF